MKERKRRKETVRIIQKICICSLKKRLRYITRRYDRFSSRNNERRAKTSSQNGEVPSKSWRMVSCCTVKAIVAAHCRGTANPDSPAVAFAATMADDRPAMPRDQGFRPQLAYSCATPSPPPQVYPACRSGEVRSNGAHRFIIGRNRGKEL